MWLSRGTVSFGLVAPNPCFHSVVTYMLSLPESHMCLCAGIELRVQVSGLSKSLHSLLFALLIRKDRARVGK